VELPKLGALQLVQTYLLPDPPETGEVALIVCVVPGVQVYVRGVVI
jgi:hypothetical protein